MVFNENNTNKTIKILDALRLDKRIVIEWQPI